MVDPGKVTAPTTPFDAKTAFYAASKVKNLLTGMPITDDDLSKVTTKGAAGLQELVSTWMTTDPHQAGVEAKMIGFFRNMFQQTGFIPTEDFKLQLLTNGGFDFGGTNRTGDDAFPVLVQNLQDSFARTAWQLVKEGRPFTETLTTNKFRMTTALKSLYVQIELPNDTNQRSTSTTVLNWTIDYSGAAIPIEQSVQSMVWSDEAPVMTAVGNRATCRGGTVTATGAFKGTSKLFQRLLGFTPELRDANNDTLCDDHPSRPLFTAQDLSDWSLGDDRAQGEPRRPHARHPALRPARAAHGDHADAVAAALRLLHDAGVPGAVEHQRQQPAPRHRQPGAAGRVRAGVHGGEHHHPVLGGRPGRHARGRGHRVRRLPPDAGPDAAVLGEPARLQRPQRFSGRQPQQPRQPPSSGGVTNEFAFGDVRATGSSMADLGTFLAQVTDGAGLPRFGISVVQQLCFYANSAPCSESDAEFRRIVGAFKDSSFNFAVLAKEFFSSPLVTGAAATGSFPAGEVPISIARRDHLCAALSNRLGKPDLCVQAIPLPSNTQRTTNTIAASVAADAFSRGAQAPVTPSEPTMFYRAATEMLCENIAKQVVDGTAGPVYLSSDIPGAIKGMVETVMGYPPSHPLHRAGGADPDGPPGCRRGRSERLNFCQGNCRPAIGVRARVRIAAGPGNRTLKEAWR